MYETLKAFFARWPEIINATSTPEKLVALLILAMVAVLLLAAARAGKDRPWFYLPLLMTIMIAGVMGLASLVIPRLPSASPPVIEDIEAGYGMRLTIAAAISGERYMS